MGLIQSKHIFKAYLYFYKKRYSESQTYTLNSQSLCDTFIKLLTQHYESLDRVGIDFLWIYLIFQFEYWKDLDIKAFNGKVNPSLVVGKKAFARFTQRDDSFDWQIFEEARGYNRKEFEQSVGLNAGEQSAYNSDDLYRKNHLNTEIGLSNCISFTSLFDPKSQYCQQCRMQQDCLEVQQQLYPRVYSDRKIENGSKTTTRQQQVIPDIRRRAM